MTNVAIPYYRNQPVMYPISTKQIIEMFKLKSSKDSSMIIWDMYDNELFSEIKQRTEEEVKDCIKIYNVLNHKGKPK